MPTPKKKKRRKHQDTPTQATTPAAAAAGPTAPASTAPKPPKHVHHAGFNGPAALVGGAANSPARFSPANGAAVASTGGSHAAATGRTPHADQATANGSSEQQAIASVDDGAADPEEGTEHMHHTVPLWHNSRLLQLDVIGIANLQQQCNRRVRDSASISGRCVPSWSTAPPCRFCRTEAHQNASFLLHAPNHTPLLNMLAKLMSLPGTFKDLVILYSMQCCMQDKASTVTSCCNCRWQEGQAEVSQEEEEGERQAS